jgi:hypothetical protein
MTNLVDLDIKKSVFLYWFQKCTYDLSKKCNQYEKTGFLIPTSPNLKKKSVYLFEATMNTPCEKDQKCKKQLNISKTVFINSS